MPRPKGSKAVEQDWPALALEYICGSDAVTLPTMSKKHGIALSTLGNHCKKEQWGKKRRVYRAKTFEKAINGQEKKEVKKMQSLASAADSMSKAIETVLKDEMQFKRHLVKTATDEVEEKVFQKADSKAIRDLTASIKDLVLIMQALYEGEKSTEDASGGVIVLADVDSTGDDIADE